MPLYSIAIQAGLLDAGGRARLAEKITAMHCGMAGVPPEWVHVVFTEYAPGCAFTAGRPAPTVGLTVVIRTGRSPDYKRGMLEGLGALLKSESGASDEEVVVGILEVPASQALEMGQVMQDV